MKSPELLVTPRSMEHISELADAGANAVIIGEQQYGLRLAGEFSTEQVREAISLAHKKNMKAYVAMNAIFHNDKIKSLEDYIQTIKSFNADAIIFGDPAVLMMARPFSLHWSAETIATNWYTCNYWGRKGAKRAVLAREISMEAIIETKQQANVEIEVQVYGPTCMFQSKRSLIGNYFEYQGSVMEIENRKQERGMLLHDKERDNKYPIFEDVNGTHIMSPNDMCIIDELEEMIDAGIDSFKIDGVLHTEDYITEITKKYRHAIDLCIHNREQYNQSKGKLLAEIKEIQPKQRPLDTGFFFKETVY